jgi:trimeric autotransporter adhesin
MANEFIARNGIIARDDSTITGSLNVTGGITGSTNFNTLINKPTLVSGSSQITYSGISSIPSGIISGSAQVVSSLPSGTVSGSSQITISSTTGYTAFSSSLTSTDNAIASRVSTIEGRYATTGSNVFKNDQTITGSINFTGNLYQNGQLVALSTNLGIYATTGSNTFNGNQTINGSISASGGITGSLLGSATSLSPGRTINGTLFNGTSNINVTNLRGTTGYQVLSAVSNALSDAALTITAGMSSISAPLRVESTNSEIQISSAQGVTNLIDPKVKIGVSPGSGNALNIDGGIDFKSGSIFYTSPNSNLLLTSADTTNYAGGYIYLGSTAVQAGDTYNTTRIDSDRSIDGTAQFQIARYLDTSTYGGLFYRYTDITGHSFYTATGRTATSTSEVLRITNIGNVGIGTTSPNSRFHISDTNQSIVFLSGSNTSGYTLNIGLGNDGVNFANNSNARGFNFKNTNGSLVTINSSGRVGIGTTSPSQLLEVNGGILISSSAYVENALERPGFSRLSYAITSNSSTGNIFVRSLTSSKSPVLDFILIPSGSSDVTPEMRLVENGLLIGTTAETVGYKLKVASDILVNDLTIGLGGGNVYENIALGNGALYNNTTGLNNIAIGYSSLVSNTIGIENVAIGKEALTSNTSGSGNYAMGTYSLLNNTTGGQNVALGLYTLGNNTTQSGSVAIGYESQKYIASGISDTANTSIGHRSLMGSNVVANNYGYDNTAIGSYSLYSNANASFNTGIGAFALYSNVSGSWNTSIGNESMYYNIRGASNTAIGNLALYSLGYADNRVSNGNVSVGDYSFLNFRYGDYNTGIGKNVLYRLISGSNNISIGYEAGSLTSTSTNNSISTSSIFIGNNTKPNGSGQTNQIVIGDSSVGIGSNTTTIGNNSTTKIVLYGNLGLGTTNPLYPLDIIGTADINGTLLVTGSINVTGSITSSGDININGNFIGNGGGDLNGNFAAGYLVFQNNTTGNYNTAMGQYSLQNNTTGGSNTAYGVSTLQNNSIGTSNVAVGVNSLLLNVSGSNNTAVGYYSLASNVTQGGSTAMGHESQRYISSSQQSTTANTSYGYQSLRGSTTVANNTGYQNTAIGFTSLLNNTSGIANVGLGYNSLVANSSGNYNIALGNQTLENNSTQNYSIAIGHQSQRYVSSSGTTAANVSIGYQALYGNASPIYNTGVHNIAIGYASLFRNESGQSNIGVGSSTLFFNTSGLYNQAIGYQAMYYNTEGLGNVAIGQAALYNNKEQDYSVAIGYQSQYYVSSSQTTTGNVSIGSQTLLGSPTVAFNTGFYNTAIGHQSLYANTTGSRNTGVGYHSLYNNISGSYNVAVGYYAGRFITGGSTGNQRSNRSIYIGNDTRAFADGDTNEIIIGDGLTGLGSNTTTIGNSSTATTALYGDVVIGSTTDNGSDKLQVTGNTSLGGNVKIGNATANIHSVTGSFSINGISSYSYDVAVGGNSLTSSLLRDSSQNGVTTSSFGKAYRVKMVTTGTGTSTGEVWLAQNPTGSGWSVSRVYSNAYPGVSNYPYLTISASLPVVTLAHPSVYGVRMFVEEITLGNLYANNGVFGLDTTISAVGSNVGINIEAPTGSLHIQSSNADTLYLSRTGFGTFNITPSQLVTGTDLAFTPIQASSGYWFRVKDSSNNSIDSLVLKSDGKIGIGSGSINPTTNLEVWDANGVVFRSSSVANTQQSTRIMGGAYSGNRMTGLMMGTTSTSNTVSIGGGTSLAEPSTAIQFYIGSIGTNATGTIKATINSTGLAVGTTSSPSYNLDVTQNARLYGAGGTAIFRIERSDPIVNAGVGAIGWANTSNYINSITSHTDVSTTGSGYIAFRAGTQNSNAYLVPEQMRLTSNGTLLIGTTSELPGYDLQVTGNSLIVGTQTVSSSAAPALILSTVSATTSASIVSSGYNTKGGNSYYDFLSVTNTTASALTPTKWFRLDNSGSFQIISSNYATQSLSLTDSGNMTINGSITMPNRPAFRVTGTGGTILATTVISGSKVTVDYNQGSYYTASSGTFTAPIDGLYQVNIVCRVASNTGPSTQVIVYKNNTTTSPINGTSQIMLEWAANTTANHIGGSTISKLAAGDTLKAIVTLGTASFDGNDNFSVAYIG